MRRCKVREAGREQGAAEQGYEQVVMLGQQQRSCRRRRVPESRRGVTTAMLLFHTDVQRYYGTPYFTVR